MEERGGRIIENSLDGDCSRQEERLSLVKLAWFREKGSVHIQYFGGRTPIGAL